MSREIRGMNLYMCRNFDSTEPASYYSHTECCIANIKSYYINVMYIEIENYLSRHDHQCDIGGRCLVKSSHVGYVNARPGFPLTDLHQLLLLQLEEVQLKVVPLPFVEFDMSGQAV